MTKRELLENYRMLVIEIDTLERQSKFLNQFIGGPRPVHAVQLTGMPRGTNDPEAAILQREDTDEVLDKIEARCQELRPLLDEFERIMDDIKDRRLQIIIRDYYALRPVLLRVTLLAKCHQVPSVQRDERIIDVISCQRFFVMNVHRRLDQSFSIAQFAQATTIRQHSSPGLSPGRRCVELFDRFIMMHSRTLLAVIGVRPHSCEE